MAYKMRSPPSTASGALACGHVCCGSRLWVAVKRLELRNRPLPTTVPDAAHFVVKTGAPAALSGGEASDNL